MLDECLGGSGVWGECCGLGQLESSGLVGVGLDVVDFLWVVWMAA